MLILIPPSEGKNEGGEGPCLSELPAVTQELLVEAEKKDKTKLYKSRTQEAIELNDSLLGSPTLPAIERYSGVVYDAIDYASMEHTDFFDEHVRIISGLFGLLKPQDMIPNYKFPIRLLGAARKWHDEITTDVSGEFIIDLLPNAHKRAVDYEDGWVVEFTREKNGKIRKAGHAGKTIKGKFIRWVCENELTDVEEMKKFSQDGYAWNGKSFHKSE